VTFLKKKRKKPYKYCYQHLPQFKYADRFFHINHVYLGRYTMSKTTAVRDAMTKTQLLAEIAEDTGLAKKDISAVLDSLGAQINRHVKKGAVGQFTLPGLLKIKTVKKPARPAQKNVPNPFQPGTTMDVAAKPASVQVKALALKKLKDMAK
jgi:nucleoid DNA-binding protein